MQRNIQDIGNLGYVRRQLPERLPDAPRGKHASQRHAAEAGKQAQRQSFPREATSSAKDAVTTKIVAVESVLEDMRAHGGPLEDLSSTNSRVDQISMKVSVLDNALKSTEKSLAALREEHGSIAKTSGGQTSERVDALDRQLRTLEESFCSFSARLERQCREVSDGVARLSTAVDSRADTSTASLENGLAALTAKVRACEDLCSTLQGKPLAASEVIDAVVSWLKCEAIPDIKRTLSQADRSDILQAATMAAHDKLAALMKEEVAAVACTPELVHRCSLPMEARVLRATNGRNATETVVLRHPIKVIGDTSYMHYVERGRNGAVAIELFPVEDSTGPLVAFV